MSGWSEADPNRAAGFDRMAFVPKPFAASEMTDAVNRLCSRDSR
jgi:hypothetical protein